MALPEAGFEIDGETALVITDPLPYPASGKLMPVAACNACHQANAVDDWVFTQYYPVIRAAKPKK